MADAKAGPLVCAADDHAGSLVPTAYAKAGSLVCVADNQAGSLVRAAEAKACCAYTHSLNVETGGSVACALAHRYCNLDNYDE